jgi:hypothetical protein
MTSARQGQVHLLTELANGLAAGFPVLASVDFAGATDSTPMHLGVARGEPAAVERWLARLAPASTGKFEDEVHGTGMSAYRVYAGVARRPDLHRDVVVWTMVPQWTSAVAWDAAGRP